MILVDVNVLVYASRSDAIDHENYRAWLEDAFSGPTPFVVSDFILSSYIRIVTHPRIFGAPSTLDEALDFTLQVREAKNGVYVQPGLDHWEIFCGLCRHVHARGNLVPDAYIAALAIETESECITADRGFARFPGLRCRHPLRPS